MGAKRSDSRKNGSRMDLFDEVITSHGGGDGSIYEALVRMAQPFMMRATLVDGSGNFGSLDGDPAAAMRYTECRLTPIAVRLLDELDADTVDFQPNYDQ